MDIADNAVIEHITFHIQQLIITAHKIALDISVSQELCSDNDPCKREIAVYHGCTE